MMYRELSKHYDCNYSGKDYAAESDLLVKMIGELAPGAKTLLDVACGSGAHLSHLSKIFQCEGIDIDSAVIEQARVSAPGVRLEVADMEKLDLGRKFDVVTCLFSSIAYVENVESMAGALGRIADHMNPNGILIVEPWVMPESWLTESSNLSSSEIEAAKAQMANIPPADRGKAAIQALSGPRVSVEHLKSQPQVGWFMLDEYSRAFDRAGINYRLEMPGLTGRGLFTGERRR